MVAKAPYRLLLEKTDWAKAKINEMLKRNIIRESSSNYATPVVLHPKQGGVYRLCQDYRANNQVTDPEPFPFPVIDDLIAKFGGYTHYWKIDLADGFWELGLTASILPSLCRSVTTK